MKGHNRHGHPKGGGGEQQLQIQSELVLTMRPPEGADRMSTTELEETGFKPVVVFRQVAYQLQLAIPIPTIIVVETTGEKAVHALHWADVRSLKAIPSVIEPAKIIRGAN